MRLSAEASREAFAAARVVRLATINPDGSPHQIPITFACCSEPADAVVFAVDHKPKSGKPLRRVQNLAARPAVCLLADEWAEDWERLWWARADGMAQVLEETDARRAIALAALIARYPQYQEVPPVGPVVWIEVTEWSGWAFRSG